ncbi:unnamed protein product [Heligmosomoides polygyrus]|uniref:Secreted protein n=1 Tax=Heligmosomoides polygyrus TaxID=6339 RepID=A0A183FHS0_HELPZ|nr:unnamed protein product [Heligmosomoides polygyrus]
MAPLSVLLLVAMLGLGSGQYFYHVPMPVPFFVPEMVPMYMPVLTRPSDIVPDLASRTGGVYIRDPETLVGGKRPKTYMKVFNDRLPGGVGRGHIYESHLPGQDEFSSSYGTVQSFGSPNSQAFMTSNSDSKSFSVRFPDSPLS